VKIAEIEDVMLLTSETLSSYLLSHILIDRVSAPFSGFNPTESDVVQGFQTEVIFAEDIETTVRQQYPQGDVIEHFLSALAEKIYASYPRIPILTGKPRPSSIICVSQRCHDLGMVTFPEFPRSQERGFSEPLSVLLAISLQASELQLWDAGNGIITANSPRVSTARFVNSMSSAEAIEMAQHGRPCASPAILDQASPSLISVCYYDQIISCTF
jgi:hypothetical protein